MAAFYSIAMVDSQSDLEAVKAAFDEIDSASFFESTTDQHDLLVKLSDEEDIGQFYRVVRQFDLDRSSSTRGSTLETAFDSWISLP